MIVPNLLIPSTVPFRSLVPFLRWCAWLRLFPLLLWVGPVPAIAQSVTAIRLAVVSEPSVGGAMGDLLTADLSTNPQLQVLERDQIDRVRKEQVLSAGNQEALRIGRELGADGVLVLGVEGEATNRVLRTRLVAVRPGVVLDASRVSWPLLDPVGFSQGFVRRLGPSLPKLKISREDAVPLSVVNIRSAVQSRQGKDLERQVTQMLIERLSREPQVFVLERRRLDLLDAEKERQGKGEDEFWKGSALLEGTLNRGGSDAGRMTADLRMIPAHGGAAIELSAIADAGDLTALTEALTTKLLEAIRRRPSGSWDAAAEASRYHEEAAWALKWGQTAEAQAASDAAWFLGKRDLSTATLRVESRLAAIPVPDNAFQEAGSSIFASMWDSSIRSTIEEWRDRGAVGVTIQSHGHTTDIEVNFFFAMRMPDPRLLGPAIDALRIHADFLEAMPANEPSLESPWTATGAKALEATSEVLRWFSMAQPHPPEIRDKLADLRLEARRIQDRLLSSTAIRDFYWSGDRVRTWEEVNESLERNSRLFQCVLEWGPFWQDQPENMVALYRRLMSSPAFACIHQWFWVRHPGNPRLVGWSLEDKKRAFPVWQAFRNELGQSTNILLRMEAKALEVDDAGSSEELKSAMGGLLTLIRLHREELMSIPVAVMGSDWQLQRLMYRRWFDRDIVSAIEGSEDWAHIDWIRDGWRGRQEAAISRQKASDAFRLQKEFLTGRGPRGRTNALAAFPVPMVSLDPEQARELKPLLDDFIARGKVEAGSLHAFNAEYGTVLLYQAAMAWTLDNPVASTSIVAQIPPQPRPNRPTPPPPAPIAPVARVETTHAVEAPPRNLLVIRDHVPIPLGLLTNQPVGSVLRDFQWIQFEPVGERFWFDIRYVTVRVIWKGGESEVVDSSRGIGLLWNPKDGSWEHVRHPAGIPPERKTLRGTTAWFRDSLYMSDWDTFLRWDPAVSRWETLEPAWQDPAQLRVIGGRLFGASSNAIVEVVDSGKGVRILASSRRRPALSALDRLDTFGNALLFPGSGDGLRARVGGRIFGWDGKDWAPLLERSESWVWHGVTDTLVTPPLRKEPWGVWRFSSDAMTPVELDIPRIPPDGPPVDNPLSRIRQAASGTGQDRIYNLPRSRGIVADGDHAYFYQDLSGVRKIGGRDEPSPVGGRHGYLTRVGMRDGRVERVSVLFESPGGLPPSEVLDGFFGGPMWPEHSVGMVFTANELFVWKRRMTGFWRIPRTELESAFAKARE